MSYVIGLIGENPNDTQPIEVLLKNILPNASFIPLVNNIHGSNLDDPKMRRFLRIEFESENPDLVIAIRDLDALRGEEDQTRLRNKFFASCKSICNGKGSKKTDFTKLLCIYEFEAFLFADYENTERHYGGSIPQALKNKDPEAISEPKEELKKLFSYQELDAAVLFDTINHEILLDRLRCYRDFYNAIPPKYKA